MLARGSALADLEAISFLKTLHLLQADVLFDLFHMRTEMQ